MADRYWVGGTASWDATAGTKWATTSGGAGGAAVPTSSDDVFFNAASGAVAVTVSSARTCRHFSSAGFTGSFINSSTALTIVGNVIVGVTLPFSLMYVNGTCAFTTNGNTINSIVVLNDAASFVTLQDAYNGLSIQIAFGTLDMNGFNVTLTGSMTGNNANVKTLDTGGGLITLTAASSVAFGFQTNTTFTVPPNILFTGGFGGNNGTKTVSTVTAAGTVTFNCSGPISLANNSPTTITDLVITKTDDEHNYLLVSSTHGLTLINPPTITGFSSGDNLLILGSIGANGQSTISVTSGTITFDHVAIQNVGFTGGATFEANNSYDLGNNAGITFNTAPIPQRVSGIFA